MFEFVDLFCKVIVLIISVIVVVWNLIWVFMNIWFWLKFFCLKEIRLVINMLVVVIVFVI